MSDNILPNLLASCQEALTAADLYKAKARQATAALVSDGGKISPALINREQFAVHGFAWLSTYVEALRETLGWASRLEKDSACGELEQLLLQAGFSGYLAQMTGGIAMSQVEIVQPGDMDIASEDVDSLRNNSAVAKLIAHGNTPKVKLRIAELIRDGAESGNFGNQGLDETLTMIRDQFRRFTDDNITPYAHGWHSNNEFIPMSLVEQMSELGVFGLTIPEEYQGHGLGKTAMCLVSEELCRGYIGVGSLGTRSEIAAELILGGGTDEQKAHWLPKIASGEILPTAVFTEPNIGSDLANLTTRAEKIGDKFRVVGNKTWITHASRADLMTLLVRSKPEEKGYRGLSMLLATKPRGDDDEPFPVDGMSGGEIEVIGYRGMKEYEIAFDGFEVAGDGVLGGEEGQGFKQLMNTFESARIQTAARAVGVAQNAMELGLSYACERQQFGNAIFDFPRVHGKLAWMAVETMMARQMAYFAAREKDQNRRCDLEAGMAKLLAARVAWSAADNAVQIHGGNGFSTEFPISRVLADARILNIFEGAGEIQAQVIARRILEGAN